jgi:hypothetical protein
MDEYAAPSDNGNKLGILRSSATLPLVPTLQRLGFNGCHIKHHCSDDISQLGAKSHA